MFKEKRNIAIVAAVVVVLVVLVGLFVSSGGSKEAIDKDKFAETMKSNGYDVVDQSSMIADGSDFSVVYLAQPKDASGDADAEVADVGTDDGSDVASNLFVGQHQVEYYKFDDAEKCEASFDKLDDELVAVYKDASGYTTTEKHMGNQQKRAVTTDKLHYVISRIEDTLVIAIAPKDKASEVDGVVKALGYN